MKLLFSIIGFYQNKLYKISSMKFKGNEFVCINHFPTGSHVTIHDADYKNKNGIIQLRAGKGTFKTMPGSEDLGNKIHLKNIPRFSEIDKPIPIFDSFFLIEPTSMIRGSEESEVIKLGRIIIVDLNRNTGDWIGWDLAMCSSNKVNLLPEFFRKRLSFWSLGYEVKQEQIYVNSEVTPAVSISFYSCKDKTIQNN